MDELAEPSPACHQPVSIRESTLVGIAMLRGTHILHVRTLPAARVVNGSETDVQTCRVRILRRGVPVRATELRCRQRQSSRHQEAGSYEVEVQASGQKGPVMGENPTGYVVFTPEGRMFFILTGEARKPAKTDQERAGLMSTLVAYTGTYRVEGDKWTTKVEVAGLESRVGRHRTNPVFQAGRRSTASVDAVARDAKLGRQGDDAQYRHLRAVQIDFAGQSSRSSDLMSTRRKGSRSTPG